MHSAAIVFHSVCGNTYLLAREYQRTLENLGVSTTLFRTLDPNYEIFAPIFPASREFQEEINLVPIINDPTLLLPYDAIFMGSPTYFGNVSASMKAFMDSFSSLWCDAKLHGKLFGAFASSSTPQGAGDMCLMALNIFAQHMGMLPIPIPANVAGIPQPAYGILHFSGEDSTKRPNADTCQAIESFLTRAVNILCG